MKLVIYPPVDDGRLSRIQAAAREMEVANVPDEATALAEITDADAFFGKLTPELLAAADNLRWVQSPTASLEHYLFPRREMGAGWRRGSPAHVCLGTRRR